MKIVTLAAAAFIGGAITFMAPTAEAMPIGTAPIDVTETTDVQKVHGRHCRIRRGHRSRCRRVKRRYRRSRHRHGHYHGGRYHRHRHYGGHHGRARVYRRNRHRPRIGLYFY